MHRAGRFELPVALAGGAGGGLDLAFEEEDLCLPEVHVRRSNPASGRSTQADVAEVIVETQHLAEPAGTGYPSGSVDVDVDHHALRIHATAFRGKRDAPAVASNR